MKTCIHKMICRTSCIMSAFTPLVNLIARLYMANIFFKSGLAKLDNWNSTLYLFQHEYKVPLLSYGLAAFLATAVEIFASVALALGLGTRLAALSLFVMTLVINYTYQEMPENYYWMVIFSMIMAQGGKRISIDYLMKLKFCQGNSEIPCCNQSCGHVLTPRTEQEDLKDLTVNTTKKKSTAKKKKK
jgi:putative oxidoreductase